MTALRISRLCARYGISQARAAMLAALIWGGGND
ncbi:hypothetical protein SAMN05421772_101678 [Paracoccus saliphilus]|uniref:Uncharacterized protein n=1 Tax=Paracoccus saliphilus TaxID=405559 RepID=A0AA45W1S3_9RHOB|nr:hypothetical protein SAMN05421772_101678 [Paracoccus saliphilus]